MHDAASHSGQAHACWIVSSSREGGPTRLAVVEWYSSTNLLLYCICIIIALAVVLIKGNNMTRQVASLADV